MSVTLTIRPAASPASRMVGPICGLFGVPPAKAGVALAPNGDDPLDCGPPDMSCASIWSGDWISERFGLFGGRMSGSIPNVGAAAGMVLS
jgi:hypothetical protein